MYDRYEAELFTQLFKCCRSRGWLPERFPESEDINSKWNDISAEFIQDAVREFNSYPLATLAWSAYIGAAVAKWWDKDWEVNSLRGYSSLLGERGFDLAVPMRSICTQYSTSAPQRRMHFYAVVGLRQGQQMPSTFLCALCVLCIA